MISRADPCFSWGEACFVSQFSMCLVYVGVQEFEFMPTGEAGRRKCFASWWHRVASQGKAPTELSGLKQLHNGSGAGREGGAPTNHLSSPEVGCSSLAEAGGSGRPARGQRSAAGVLW